MKSRRKKPVSFSRLGDGRVSHMRLASGPSRKEAPTDQGSSFTQGAQGGSAFSTAKLHPSEAASSPGFSTNRSRMDTTELPWARVVPGLFNVAIIGKFSSWPWGQHPDEAYLADEMACLGVHVLRIDQSRHQIPPLGVDWAIFTGHEKSRRHLSLWRRVCPTVLWTLDWLPFMPERSYVIEDGKRVSLFITSDRYEWAHLGIAHHKYLPGACEGRIPAFSPEPQRTCAFVGTLYNERRQAIAKIVRDAGGVVLDQPGAWVYGENLARFVQETKVVVGDNYRNDVSGYWSSRNYVVPGAGGFLLASQVPGIEEQFTPNEHIGVYSSLQTLPAALDRWIRDDLARERIRRTGFLHVRKNHGWRIRAIEMLNLMGFQPSL